MYMCLVESLLKSAVLAKFALGIQGPGTWPCVPGNAGVPRGRDPPPALALPPPQLPPPSSDRMRAQRQALCLLMRSRDCVGGGACVGWKTGLSGRGRLLWGNRLLQGPVIMRLNSLGTCTTRSGPSAQYGKMPHRALSFPC